MDFVVGDVIEGLAGNGCIITRDGCVCVVTSVTSSRESMRIKVLSSDRHPTKVGCVYSVDNTTLKFKLIEPRRNNVSIFNNI